MAVAFLRACFEGQGVRVLWLSDGGGQLVGVLRCVVEGEAEALKTNSVLIKTLGHGS